MSIVECKDVIVNLVFRLVGKFGPAVADIRARFLEPPQQGNGIAHVEIIGRGRIRPHLRIV